MSQEKNEKLGFSKKSSGVVLKDVTKIFQQPDTGKDFVAVDHINLEIKDGEMVTLLGPSGCGKTTTLRMISGFEYPTSGNVFIGDRDVAKIPPNKRGISMVFQSYALFPHLNIWENIAYGLRVAKLPQDEIIRRTNDVVELMQLKGMEKRFPNQLSGGQQQRVALAAPWSSSLPCCCLTNPCPTWTPSSVRTCGMSSAPSSSGWGSPLCTSPMTSPRPWPSPTRWSS